MESDTKNAVLKPTEHAEKPSFSLVSQSYQPKEKIPMLPLSLY